jgi:Uma2 family endonuclease
VSIAFPNEPITATDSSDGDERLSVPLDSVKRFTVAQYHALIDAGMFADDENYELLEGLLVHKLTKNPDHWIATDFLRDALQALAIAGYFVHSQNPVTTSDSEPEPDLALVRGKRRDYRGGNPDPGQVPLVAEVADSSLRRDRGLKKRIYARAGIRVYWIVNLINRQVEVYSEPSGPAKKPDYKKCEIIAADGTLPVLIDGKVVGKLKVKDLLP